jgi:hypothetical protein
MKSSILIFVVILFAHKTFAQEFWEYVGLKGFVIANIIQDNSGRLYSTEWQGFGDSVFFSDDFGKSWFSFGEVNDSEFVRISSILFLENNDILISSDGSETGGIYKSTDGSKNWEQKNTGASINSCTKILINSDEIFASIYDAVYVSVDKGESWSEFISKPDSGNEIVDIARAKDGKLFAATFSEIFRSDDNGSSWQLITNGIPPTADFFMNLTLSDEGYIYLGTRRSGIYRTNDCGDNWEYIRQGWIRYVTTKPGGYIMAGAEQEGLIFSTDYGDTWQIENSGLPGSLPNTSFINSVYFDKDGYAYCSVHNYGIYRSALPVSVEGEEENSQLSYYVLYQNFPNPFNSFTEIIYQLPKSGLVQLKVFDLLGSEVSVLVNEVKSAGKYEISFDASNLPSGVYLYSLRVNDFVQNNKMTLLK